MKALTINAAAIMFAAIMFTSCDKESLVPITDVTRSSTFLDKDVRPSDGEKNSFGDSSEDSSKKDSDYRESTSDENARQSDAEKTWYGERGQTQAASADKTSESEGNARQSDAEKSGFENSDKPETGEKTYPNSLSETTASRDWKQREGSEKTHADETDSAKDDSGETTTTVNTIKVEAQKK